ncbi:co-chaperone GroES [Streptococcus sp. H49]|uniref:co-chaperone GroES n=1 Tax=Streptococcus huangxiaojuni TaxID=3237239 RepID=UPI0034A4581C
MLKPLGDRVVLKVEEAKEQTVGGFVLAGGSKEKTQLATVQAVGAGTRALNGDLIELSVKVGDTVVFEEFAGVEVKDAGESYLLVHESDILAVVQ